MLISSFDSDNFEVFDNDKLSKKLRILFKLFLSVSISDVSRRTLLKYIFFDISKLSIIFEFRILC